MTEEAVFFKQAAEAIVATSLNAANVNPTIKELLNRIKTTRGSQDLLNSINFVIPAQTNLFKDGSAMSISPPAADGLNDSVSSSYINMQNTLSPDSISMINGTDSEPSIKRQKLSTNVKRASLSAETQQTAHKKSLSTHNSIQSASSSESMERKHPCSKCELVFLRSSDLKRHEKAHLLVLPNICSRCGKGFARKDALKRHFNTLTCTRNRNKLIEMTGVRFEEILERAQKNGVGL